ncbi:hypothetical protein ACFV83_09425 [Streptomyces pharetrae]|uniref:hypothetical protein n=1 Tax=Streptomyces pharetrae TaxID=291370 RepID=UPI00365896FA
MTASGSLGMGISGDHNRITVHGPIMVGQAPKRPRSSYLLEVNELAAHAFKGRREELAAMTAFVSAPEGSDSGYWRWVASAWAGKTALMAHFTLNPPEGTDVLAFFITARMAGRADRTAFLSALEMQLRAYLHDADIECTSQGAFLEALQRAAFKASANGRRLLLAVDGLDEDTGVTTANTGHSIAALLPRSPVRGLRIIVAGRPNPPIPGDVPPGHPLRDPALNHELAPSAAAWVVKEDAERNLESLIAAGGLGEELVGLTAAAGGGLTAADLAQLTDQTQRRIELTLGGTIGRAFQWRPTHWTIASDGRPEAACSFAHQELLDSARQLFTPGSLETHRQTLHAWADKFGKADWPTTTPEWVLTGYPRMLVALKDANRLTTLATDPARHERLWQTTGTDVEAFAEIADTFTLHCSADDPDLSSCVRLAHHREMLRGKAANTPKGVILAWAHLGHVRRAITLAAQGAGQSSYALPAEILAVVGVSPESVALTVDTTRAYAAYAQTLALAAIAEEVRKSGRRGEAADIARHAATVARDITQPDDRDDALTAVARNLAAAGEAEEAADLALAVMHPGQKGEALGAVAVALAETGQQEAATSFARQAAALNLAQDDGGQQAQTLCTAAKALARAGQREEAINLAQQAATFMPVMADADEEAWLRRGVVEALTVAGQAQEAATLARESADFQERADTLRVIAETLAKTGQAQEAATLARESADLARALPNLEARAQTLGAVAEILTNTGQVQEAVTLARESADLARALPNLDQRNRILGTVAETVRNRILCTAAETLAKAGQAQEAATLARHSADLAHSIPDGTHRARILGAAAAVLAEVGQAKEASALAQQAAHLARGVTDTTSNLLASVTLSSVLAESGAAREAAHIARQVAPRVRAIVPTRERFPSDPHVQALLDLVQVLAQTGHAQEAAALVGEFKDLGHQARATAVIGEGLAQAGQPQKAVDFTLRAAGLAERITPEYSQAVIMGLVASVWARIGQTERAAALARSISIPAHQASSLQNVVRAIAESGRPQEAADLAGTFRAPYERARGLLTIAKVLNGAAQQEYAADLVRQAAILSSDMMDRRRRAEVLRVAAQALAEAGQSQEAVALSCTITDYPAYRAGALCSAAVALSRAGQRDEAMTLVQEASTLALANADTQALHDTAKAVAHLGRARDAADIARTIDTYWEMNEALRVVATELAGTGQAQEAADIVRAIIDDEERYKGWRGIAESLAHIGQIEEAVDIARTIPEPYSQAGVLATISVTQAGTHSGALLAEALAIGSPVHLAGFLAAHDVRAVQTLARCLGVLG